MSDFYLTYFKLFCKNMNKAYIVYLFYIVNENSLCNIYLKANEKRLYDIAVPSTSLILSMGL